MDIEILEFIPDPKGMKLGNVDFKVTYSPEKYEIFRNVSYFEKEDRGWLNIGSIQRDGEWLPRYERAPSIRNMLDTALLSLKEYINQQNNNFSNNLNEIESNVDDVCF